MKVKKKKDQLRKRVRRTGKKTKRSKKSKHERNWTGDGRFASNSKMNNLLIWFISHLYNIKVDLVIVVCKNFFFFKQLTMLCFFML